MKTRSFSTLFNIAILIVMIICFFTMGSSGGFRPEHAASLITGVSLVLLASEVLQLKRRNIGLFSIILVFFVLCHIFFLGNFYLKAFGKEEFYLYNDWLNSEANIKIQAGFFSLLTIHSLFTGAILALDNNKNDLHREFRFAHFLSSEIKESIIFKAGLFMLAIGLPFELSMDMSRIQYSSINNVYSGFEGVSGIADDLYVFFVPSLICLMYGKRNKKCFSTCILIVYLLWSVFVMAASGARREYVTGIIALVFCYYHLYYEKQINKSKFHFLRNLLIIIVGMILLNFLTMIRNYRHIQLGIMYLLSENFEDLFSLDVVWETIAEFSLTGSPIFFSVKFFPETIPYQYGFTYLASIIYILPIGWLIDLNSSIGAMLYEMTGWAAGGSLAADLYANWGWFSCLFSVLLGYIISKLCDSRNDSADVCLFSTVIAFSVGYVILTYPRASTSEIVRHGAYVYMLMYFFFRMYSAKKRKL